MQPLVMLNFTKFCDLMNQWHFEVNIPLLPFCEERHGATKKSWAHEGPTKIKKIWAHEGPSILKVLYIYK